ncbi:tRNA (adenosine(37)-N6)-threonylcarbamoyltransferase complex transferase subunit TsaD [Candidatus Peregrinibacteria bacterium]|nr:tRNA (adenosine(37)-N6)-threonylcarbamoyltransferase complex transferase subunit TsaD [Candidatus Peregrinibacteria bacterium]
MKILGIETSCDETAASVVKDGYGVLSNVIGSSEKLHEETKGIVPEIAARDSALKIAPILQKAVLDARVSWEEIDAIAVTNGPGLLGSLLVGIEAAKTLALLYKKPLIPVFHIAGHLFSNILERKELPHFPVISLTVSGGHNDLYVWERLSEIQKLGSTIDDAAGEAFDKGARMLGLPYPGGPHLSRIAEGGDAQKIHFPRPMKQSGDFNFSFSGLKTALFYEIRNRGGLHEISDSEKADLAASYQEAIVEILLQKLFSAADAYSAKEVHLAGGVSANKRLRERFLEEAQKRNLLTRIPEKMSYSTDNAAMIAAAGYVMWENASKETRKTFTIQNLEVNLSHEFRM